MGSCTVKNGVLYGFTIGFNELRGFLHSGRDA